MRGRRKNYGGWLLNSLTLLCVGLTMGVLGGVAHVFVQPRSPLNPYPPPEGLSLPLNFLTVSAITPDQTANLEQEAEPTTAADSNSAASAPAERSRSNLADSFSRSNASPIFEPTSTPVPPALERSAMPTPTTRLPSDSNTAAPIATETNAGSPASLPAATSTPGTISSLPKCVSHDPTTYHSLVDEQRGCHYTHTHNQNPADGDAIFGPLSLSQSISYPWQTPHENMAKHAGYKWDVEIKDQCHPRPGINYPHCVMAWRIQHHSVGGATGAATRLHSYYAEVLVCRNGDCGIIRTGGWSDFGILMVPYKGERVVLSNDATELDTYRFGAPPYRGHPPAQDCPTSGGRCNYVWNSSNRLGYNQFVSFDFRVADDFGGLVVHGDGTISDRLICPDFHCRFNHSQFWVYEVLVEIPNSLDEDGDGFVTFDGFVDTSGNINPSCHTAGPNCAPLTVENAPVGRFAFNEGLNIVEGSRAGRIEEFDLSPPGEWWIEYPN